MGSVRYKEICQNGETEIEEIHKVVVYRFKVSESEDPDLYASQPLWEWQNSDQGKFVMSNAIETPIWQKQLDYASFCYNFAVVAELPKSKLSEYYLRWGKP